MEIIECDKCKAQKKARNSSDFVKIYVKKERGANTHFCYCYDLCPNCIKELCAFIGSKGTRSRNPKIETDEELNKRNKEVAEAAVKEALGIE